MNALHLIRGQLSPVGLTSTCPLTRGATCLLKRWTMKRQATIHEPFRHRSHHIPIHTRNYSTDNVTWLWPLTDAAKGFYEANRIGTRMGYLEHTISSAIPLEKEHFHQAFEYMMKKIPNMRTVVRKRGDSHWYCQLHNHEMELDVLSNEETFRDESIAKFNKGFSGSETLPWKATMISDRANSPFYVKGEKGNPYQYRLIVSFNHALTDGMDCISWMLGIIDGLNYAVGDGPSQERNYGVFEDNKEFETKVKEREKELLKNPAKLEDAINSLPNLENIPTIMQAFPRPKVSRPATKYLFREMNPLMRNGLLSKCNQMGVSFNALFISVTSMAFAELIAEAGIHKDNYEFHNLIYLSNRRYRSTKKHLHGCYMTGLTFKYKTKHNDRNNYWTYCMRVNEELKSSYDQGLVLDQVVAQALMDGQHEPFNYTDNPRPVVHDFSTNYIPILTKFLSTPNSKVQLLDVQAFHGIHNYRNALQMDLIYFRDKTHWNFHYATNYFSEEVITLLADRTFELLKVVGK